MAQCSQTAAQFIQAAFRPRVAIMAAPEVDTLCLKNNLTLAELLQPFARLNTDVQYRDPLGTLVTARDLHLCLEDWSQAAPPTAQQARRQLSECVSQSLLPLPEDGSVRPDTPWFEAWRERFLQVEPPGEHEFVRRYVACLLAVSSGGPEPLAQLQRLAQQQHQQQHGQPAGGVRWFSNNVLIYHVLVTDVSSTTEASAEAVFEQVKATYGAHCCHHLRLNSQRPEHQRPHAPDPWAEYARPRPAQTEATPARLSGADTPAEVAELTSLPSLVVEGQLTALPAAADHPLSPESRRLGSPLPERPTPPERPPAVPAGGDTELPQRDPAAPPVLNRVCYPAPAPTVTQGHGACLSASDLDRISIFISELCIRGLLPHVERQMRSLSDVVNNRKGVSRSLISATKRWFGGSKPGSGGGAAVNTVIYSQEAPEIQVRRLGDLAFMFGHYDLAYQAYHTAKRDFSADSAWLYFAGAVEMAALSVFLHGSQGKPFPQHYLDQAIATYLDPCRVPNYALRATLFSTECLKDRGLLGVASLQFIRLTAEDSDLRSALLLEQAAHCFLNSQPPSRRKYAFHMILSGHRFSKAGQRRHSLRAYQQAFQVYAGHGWRLADDHIDFTLGRHSVALEEPAAALAALGRLLAGAAAFEGRQSAAQQAAFVREYLSVCRQQYGGGAASELPQLPVPTLLAQQTRVLVSPEQRAAADGWTPASGCSFTDDEEDNAKWFRLEELCREWLGLGGPFRPTVQCMTGKTDNTARPRVCASEPVSVQLVLRNPLRVPLELSELRLQYSFEPRQPATGHEPPVTVHTLRRCLLEENSTQEVTLTITAHVPGDLTIHGYEFSLALAPADVETADQSQSPERAPSVRGCQAIVTRGRRLNATKEERSGVVYAEDKRLQVAVDEPAGLPQLNFQGLPSALVCGQLHPVMLRVTNGGRQPLHRLLLATADPRLLLLEPQPPAAAAAPSAAAVRPSPVAELAVPAGGLAPGAQLERRLWLRAPHEDGARPLELLLCAGGGAAPARPRLLRHAGRLLVTPSLAVAVRAARSSGPRPQLWLELQVSGLQAAAAPIQLEQVAVAAAGWRLDHQSPAEAVRVLRGETAYLGVSVERVPAQLTAAGEPLLHIDALPLDGRQSGSVESPALDFLLRHQQLVPAEAAAAGGGGQPEQQPAAAADADQRRQLESLSAAVRVDATVLLQWRTQGVDAAGRESTVRGQHHVTVERLGAAAGTHPAAAEPAPRPPVTIVPSSPPSPAPGLGCDPALLERLVSVVPRHRSSVDHDFRRKRLCVIPVTMLVLNHSSSDLVVHLAAVSAGGPASRAALPYSSHVSADLVWVGRTHQHVTVPAAGSAQLRLAAAVARPGLYDLGAVGVACRLPDADDTELTEQSARAESAVVVRQVPAGGRG